MALNHKLQTFVDVYDGDANKAADIAGISQQYGRRLVMNSVAAGIQPKCLEVQEAIRKRNSCEIATQATEVRSKIADRRERQEFWSKNMRDESLEMRERRENSALRGKSEADFIDVVKAEHTMRLCLGAPRRAVEADVLPEAPIEAIEGETEDKP